MVTAGVRALAALVVVLAVVYSTSAAAAGTCVVVTPQNINVYSAPCSGTVTAVVRGGTSGVLTTNAIQQCNQYWATVAFTNGVTGFVGTDGLGRISCSPAAQRTNAAAISLIEQYVPFTPTWTRNGYSGKYHVIGYNHLEGTNSPYKPGSTITQAQATSLLQADLHSTEACLLGSIKVPVTSNQFSALVSFSFDNKPILANCQSGKSSPILTDLNNGKYSNICVTILAASGNPARRAAECNLFSS